MRLIIVLTVLVGVIYADITSQFCHSPKFTNRLPSPVKLKILDIWRNYKKGDDCHMHIARTRNLLLSLSARDRSRVISSKVACQLPSVVANLPVKAQERIVEIWKRRDPHGNCREQQKKTRLILLNLPAHIRQTLRPSPFKCELPHFIYRLEIGLQTQLQRVWDGYKEGTPCHDRIEEQLKLLQANDISVESFHMPPLDMFSKIDLVRKFRRASRA